MESIVVTCCTTLSGGSSSDESGWPISAMRCSTRSLISKSVERSWRSSALRMVLGINKISYVTMLICLLLDYIRTVQSRNFTSCPGIYQALLMLSYWGLHHEDTKAQRRPLAPLAGADHDLPLATVVRPEEAGGAVWTSGLYLAAERIDWMSNSMIFAIFFGPSFVSFCVVSSKK